MLGSATHLTELHTIACTLLRNCSILAIGQWTAEAIAKARGAVLMTWKSLGHWSLRTCQLHRSFLRHFLLALNMRNLQLQTFLYTAIVMHQYAPMCCTSHEAATAQSLRCRFLFDSKVALEHFWPVLLGWSRQVMLLLSNLQMSNAMYVYIHIIYIYIYSIVFICIIYIYLHSLI